ncbi:hypothetical protein NLG97_g9043 [Lecanicillium saksenae]|uniref:Uncharacterized protein n=1 Tax=Lecanicillium saksenae TaxID=468837 RepID=A0ACC1QH66_9HYPO|nr:hypothetical protein NLG97_g9043 [Lecanicillium saksenae]
MLVVTNWLKADLAGVIDFAPAVVREGGGGKKRGPGRLVYAHAQLLEQSPATRNTVVLLSKDQDGNLWMQGVLPKRTWVAFQNELDELNKE